MTDWDEVAKEADLLALTIATGTLKARHVELGPDHPKYPDTAEQRAERERRAHQRALRRRRRKDTADQIRVEYGFQSPYPDVHETYCTGDVWEREEREADEEQVRQAANDLVAAGWPTDVVARILNITPRSQS